MADEDFKAFAHGGLDKEGRKMMVQLHAEENDMLAIIMTDFGDVMWRANVSLLDVRNQLVRYVGDGEEPGYLCAIVHPGGDMELSLRLPPHGHLKQAASHTVQAQNSELAFRLLDMAKVSQASQSERTNDDTSRGGFLEDGGRGLTQHSSEMAKSAATSQDDNQIGGATPTRSQINTFNELEGSDNKNTLGHGKGQKRKRGRGRKFSGKALKITGTDQSDL